MSNKIHEYLIYIHGVSQDNNQSHRGTYDSLHQGIQAVQESFPHRSDWERATRCDVEWGWNFDRQATPGGDRLLADAQDKFAETILPEIKKARDWTLNPARLLLFTLRELMIKGFSDMFYYASKDGKSSIRSTVASQILQQIKQPLEKGEPISLTFLGHSAGTVVAFDFLFYLFAPSSLLKEHDFVGDHQIGEFNKLRQLADNKKLRVRRLFTSGSPISMLAFRSDPVLEILANGNQLNPSDYGLDQNPDVFGSPLLGPRWLNFWDKDDIIAWPVEPLLQETQSVQDIQLDVGDHVSTVHNKYWSDLGMQQKIAEYW